MDVSRRSVEAAPELELLKQPCRENFAAQPGASTMLRFGVLDLAGNFSGWGETEAVQFPTSDVEFSAPGSSEEAGQGGDDGGCSLRAPRDIRLQSALLAAALLMGLSRRRRRVAVRR